MNRRLVVPLVIALAAGVAVFMVWRLAAPPEQAPVVAPADEGLGSSLYEKSASNNPAEKVPETNPFSAPTNPIKAAKTNPFE